MTGACKSQISKELQDDSLVYVPTIKGIIVATLQMGIKV